MPAPPVLADAGLWVATPVAAPPAAPVGVTDVAPPALLGAVVPVAVADGPAEVAGLVVAAVVPAAVDPALGIDEPDAPGDTVLADDVEEVEEEPGTVVAVGATDAELVGVYVLFAAVVATTPLAASAAAKDCAFGGWMLASALSTLLAPTDTNPTPVGAGITIPMLAARRSIR
jgi:hypothetical protein